MKKSFIFVMEEEDLKNSKELAESKGLTLSSFIRYLLKEQLNEYDFSAKKNL